MVNKNAAAVARAKALDKKVRLFMQTQRASWLEMGEAALEVSRTKAFKLLGFRTFEDWQGSLGKSRGLVFEAKSLVESYEGIDAKRRALLLDIPRENLKLLSRLPERQRFSGKYLDAASRLKTKDLRRVLDGKGFHISPKTSYTFGAVPQDALPRIEKAHAALKLFCGTGDGAVHPLEYMAQVVLESACEEHEWDGIDLVDKDSGEIFSVEQAFDLLVKKGKVKL